jgi:hypothetical protein
VSAVRPRETAELRSPYTFDAFGLAVEVDWPLAGATPGAAEAGRRPTIVRRIEPESLATAWESPGERLFERESMGEIAITIERAEDYRIQAKGFGRYVVSTDGTEVRCEHGTVVEHAQERFLFAQVLPLAAVLRGFELLHASAVCLNDAAAAFAGPSGAGKTTLMSRLVARGAGFLTDDALALERGADGAIAYPGPPYLAVLDGDVDQIDVAARIGRLVGTSDKLNVVVPVGRGAFPLRAVYHLEPGPHLALEPIGSDIVRRLLGSVFVPYLVTPERLDRQLRMAQVLDETVPQFRLQLPRALDVEEAVDVVEAHAREVTA